MYCSNCGKEIDDKAVICVYCGVPVTPLTSLTEQQKPTEKKTNGLGIAGFILSLVSLLTVVYSIFFVPIALILSIVGVAKRKVCTSANGLAVAGLVICIIEIAAWLFIIFLSFAAVSFY